MKRLLLLAWVATMCMPALAQTAERPAVLKTTLLSHLPMDGSARVALELPVAGTDWSVEPMLGLRYADYWNERDLRLSPDLRLAAYRYHAHPKKEVIVRSGLALQYRLMHSNETHRICTAYTTSEWSSTATCTAYSTNDYRRLQHQTQLGYLYGRRYNWGKVQVDLDFIVGLQLIAVETPGFLAESHVTPWIDLNFDPVPEKQGVGILPWAVVDLKFGLPVGK